jgi:predicted CoA-substrate-specific enzyme activase
MIVTGGIDVGSTYTKAVLLSDDRRLLGRALVKTGFRLGPAAAEAYHQARTAAGLAQSEVSYVVSTGYGRYQVDFRDAQVTDLTAHARGASFFFPGTRTVLDVGGQTVKASRIDEAGKVRSFRLNDKCAAGTGAFLEKTARYLGYGLEEIGPLVTTSKQPVAISGVCAVFAESEVINQLSNGSAPADIMHGAIVSLVDRSVQLLKRVRMEPEFTLVGGIMRFETMIEATAKRLGASVNVPPGELVQFTGAVGAAVLAHRRMAKLGRDETSVPSGRTGTAPSPPDASLRTEASER